MGEVIENKVVQLAFDNTKFEKGVQATLNILGRLNNAITGINTIKYNILGLADQVKAVTFDPVNTQLQIGIGKAMALTAALTGVYNITDQIYNTMVGTIRSMTFDQVYNGWARYEQLVNSTQVILASTRKEGESMESAMERVTEVQDKLMWFADETSYDAQAMLETISQFTSHGVELEKASTAMEGIANWAATAGVNATEATYAMQQLAQTIGKGYVQSQDWVSIQSRNMDTTQFKEMVINAAVARGELKKVGNEIRTLDATMDVTSANMEKSLSKKWFTKEVLQDVLTKYGEANEIIRREQRDGELVSETIERVKGMAEYQQYMLSIEAFEMGQVARTWTDALGSIQTATATKLSAIFKTIFGDYLEAKVLWTDISEKLYDIFITPLDTLMQAFQKWANPDTFKGSQRLWESFWKIFTAIEDTVTTIWTIFSKVFGIVADEKDDIEDYIQRTNGWVALLASWLDKATSKIEQFAQNFKMFFVNIRNNEKLMKNIESFFNGLKIGFEILSKAAMTFKDRVLGPLFSRTSEGIEKVSGLGGSFEKFMQDIQYLIEDTDLFNKVFDKTYEIADKFLTILIDFISKLNEFANTIKATNSDSSGEGGIFSKLFGDVTEAEGPIDKIFTIISSGLNFIDLAVVSFSPVVQKLFDLITGIFTSFGNFISQIAPEVVKVGEMIIGAFGGTAELFKESGQELTIGKLLQIFGNSIKDFLSKTGKSNVDTFIYLLSSLRLELHEWKTEFFGEGTLFDFIQKFFDVLSTNFGLLVSVVTVLFGLGHAFEEILQIKWDGLFGKVIWGDTLTNFSDQLYYKALAGTFTAIADGILAIAAALFVVSLVDPSRMEESMKVLYQIAAMMLFMAGAVQTLTEVLDKFSGDGGVSFTAKSNKFFSALETIDATFGKGYVEKVKIEGTAKIISAITWGFIKLAAAMLILDQIPDLGRIIPVMWSLAGIVMLMFLLASIMTGNYSGGMIDKSGASKGLLSKFRSFKVQTKANDILIGTASMILIAMAIGKMAKALRTVSEIPENDVWRSVGVLSIMVVLIAFLEVYTMAMVKWLNSPGTEEKNLLHIGHTISLFGWAILMIAGALTLLTKVADTSQLMEASKWLGICFAAMTAAAMAVMLLSKALKPEEAATVGIVAGLIMALSVSILAIAGALVLVSRVADPTQLDTAVGALGKIFLSFAALIVASAWIKPSQVLAVAGALALMNISTLALIPLLLTVMKIDDGAMEHLKKIFIGLGIAMGAFMAVAAIMANAPEVAGPALGYFFAIIGALGLIAVDAVILSVGLFVIAEGLKTFAESLIILQTVDGEKVKDNLINIASFFPEMFKIITQALVDGINTLLMQPFDFTLLFVNILGSIFKALTEVMPDLFNMLKESVINLVEMLKTLVPLILEFVNFFGVELTKAIVSGTVQITWALFEGFMEGMEAILPKIPDVINKFADVLIDNLSNILDAVDRLIDPIADIIDHAIKHTITILERSSGSIRTLVSSLFTLLLNLANDFGVVLTEKVTEGTIRILAAIVEGIILGIAEAIPELLEACGKGIIDLFNGIADVLDEQGDEILKAVDRLMDSIGRFILKIAMNWGAEGGVFFEAGIQAVAGITRGIASKLKVVKEAAFSLGDYVKNGFCKVLKIESPSKVFEQFGKFIPEGLLNGLASMKDRVFEKFGEFAGGIASQFGLNLSGGLGGGIEDILGGMLGSLNVDIIPNLDMTNLNGQLGELTNLFGQQQLQGMVGLDGFNMGDISLGNDSVSLNNNLEALNGKFDELITIEKFNAEKPTDVNIAMQGDTGKLFKAMRIENNKRTRTTGFNPLMGVKA